MRSPRETVERDEAPQVQGGRAGQKVFQDQERQEGSRLRHAPGAGFSRRR